ncbi:MAG TPA: hypothetical protein VMC82_07095 [Thermoplasmata archaeon]|nr:hypothetical protein [Thermoplasmata archaeon]
MPAEADRMGHPCVTSDCGHPESAHAATPELASSSEIVVWCAACRRHEVQRPRSWRFPWSRAEAPPARRRFSRPS